MASRLGRWRVGYAGVACPRCTRPLRHETLQSGLQACPACDGPFEAIRFDPVESRGVVPEIAGVGPEATAPCTRHARNQAEAACARCGQFMCSLCKIEADGKVYCPSCFDRLSTEGSLSSAVKRVKNYAGMAALCILGTFFCMFAAPVTGPLGIYFCARGIRDKRLRGEADGRARLYVLMVFCTLTLLAGAGWIVTLFGAFLKGLKT